ncbi:TetR/AcrR family transcriptional regulator [Streptomyces fuscichromogenes]|uniref:TetR/AcrR family transcriptional regulator n=1 Tax=Streptomyces fuscichromogenes TaxID=1324013 RepID=UPI00380FDA88
MTTPPSLRGEYAKSAARRREIIDAAIEVFTVAGFHKGSLRDVAERAGLSQAGLLHHFPSKNHIIEAVLTWRDAQAREVIDEARTEGGLVYLRALITLIESNQRKSPALTELYAVLSAEATSRDHPVHDYFEQRYARVTASVQKAFQEIADAGQLRAGVDPSDAARWMLALVDGLQIQWLYDRDAVDMAGSVRRYLRTLLTVDL